MIAAAPVAQEAPALRVETISSETELARLEDSWDELVRAMPRPSPFLLHGWVLEWWRHYSDGAELAVHVARRGDGLAGALPLCTRGRLGVCMSEFVGRSWAALADVLVAPGEEAAVTPLVQHAFSSGGDFASLFGLPGSSRLVAALPPDALTLVERLEAPVMDMSAGWKEAYGRKMSPKAQRDRRRRMRQLAKTGSVDCSVARTPGELALALEEAFHVHSLRWSDRRDPTGFGTEIGKRFHRAALLRLAEDDISRQVTIRIDGRAVAFALYLQFAGRAYGLIMGYDPAYARFGLGAEAKLQSIEAAAEEGVTLVELLGADAEHKRRLTDRFDPIYQGIGLARTRRGRAAAETLLAGIRLRRAAKRSTTLKKVYYRIPMKRG
ncbi:MAG TPA: GNAT family N-acetyltransferase [Gaiellaceae bacterium]|nr:GNAT family N-acetyltransferase [Gaiellaceae bacterium]